MKLRNGLREEIAKLRFKVEKIPFDQLKMWHSDPDGSIRHDSGWFFSIVGIDVNTDYETNLENGTFNHWRQPIILQQEVGYFGVGG